MDTISYEFQKITSPYFSQPWAIGVDLTAECAYIANRGNGTLVRLNIDSSFPPHFSIAVDAVRDAAHIRVALGVRETIDLLPDIMVLTPNALYRVTQTFSGLETAELVTGCSALTGMTDVSAVIYQDVVCWFVTTANGDIVRIPKNSSVADPTPLKFPGLTNCRSIACTMNFVNTDRIYVSNLVPNSPTSKQASVTSINCSNAPGRRPPFVISGASLVSPGPIGAPTFPDALEVPLVFVGNTGSSNSLARISHYTGVLDPTPITGGGIFNPLRITCRYGGGDVFVLNGNSTITRIPEGSWTPDPDPISGGGMFECQDMAFIEQDNLFITNPFSNSVTRIKLIGTSDQRTEDDPRPRRLRPS